MFVSHPLCAIDSKGNFDMTEKVKICFKISEDAILDNCYVLAIYYVYNNRSIVPSHIKDKSRLKINLAIGWDNQVYILLWILYDGFFV